MPWRIVDLRPVLLHLDLDVEADLLPHLDHDLAVGRLVRVVVVEQAVGDRIALVIGLLQEVPGERRIECRGCPAIDEHVAVAEGFELQAGRDDRLAGPERIDDRLAVDGMGHRTANQRVGEDLVLGVEDRNAVVPDRRVLDLVARSGLNGGDLVRRQVAGEVVFARQEAVDARGDFRNFHEADLLERRAAAPIFVEGNEGQRNVRLVLADHVRTRRDRLARPFGEACRLIPGAAVGDLAAAGIEAPFQRHVGRRVVQAHGVLIDDLDAGERRPQATSDAGNGCRQFLGGRRLVVGFENSLAAGGLRVTEHAFLGEGESDVLGGHFIAVVELDALAQLQLERLVVDTLPLGGKTRNRTLIAHPVTQDQAFPEVGEEDALADVGLLVVDVERVVVGDLLHRDGDGRALALAESEARQNERAGGGGADKAERAASIDRNHRKLLLS